MPYADHSGVRIHYVVEGSGPPLVLQHGFTGSWRDWETFGLVAELRHDYQLIMLDARGHGGSDKPHEPSAYGIEAAAADIIAVLDDLEIDRAHYYGYSYGGLIGWALGAYAPERFVSMAIGGAHPYPATDEVWVRVDRMRSYLEQGMGAYVAWRESQVGPWPSAFRGRALRNDAQALIAALTIDSVSKNARRFDHALPTMTMPVLVISGDSDELFAGLQARRAARELIDGQYVELEAADHFSLYVESRRVAPELRRFLASVTVVTLA